MAEMIDDVELVALGETRVPTDARDFSRASEFEIEMADFMANLTSLELETVLNNPEWHSFSLRFRAWVKESLETGRVL